MNYFMVVGLLISLLFLLLSFLVFLLCRSIHCGRVAMHMNMFFSLICNNLSWLLWYRFVLFDSHAWSENLLWCRVLNIILTYFTLCTYFSMLCEGTYLQILLASTYVVQRTQIVVIIASAWVAPIFLIIPYSVYRHHYENEHCWMDLGPSSWFLGIPIASVIITNLVFLGNVIRILRAKLSMPHTRRSSETRVFMLYKQARAALFLVPILGVYFLLLPMRPESGSQLEYAYEFLSVLSSSYQGRNVFFNNLIILVRKVM